MNHACELALIIYVMMGEAQQTIGARWSLMERFVKKPKAKSLTSIVGFDDKKPHVDVTVATNYNKVDFTPVVLDLNHLSGTNWQTHNTVVI